MYQKLGLDVSAEMFFYIMISFAFFIGIILTVAPDAFEALNRAFQREYGVRTRLLPKLEDTYIDVIDRAISKNRVLAGVIISVSAFILLLIYK